MAKNPPKRHVRRCAPCFQYRMGFDPWKQGEKGRRQQIRPSGPRGAAAGAPSPTAYAPGTNEKGGVIPAEGGPGEGTTIRAKRLAQTGDELAAGFALGAGAALAAGTALLLARRRLRRAR